MSVQFGRWSFGGAPASPEYLASVRELLAPYGPDGGASYSNQGVDLLFQAFHTTKESRLETQPHVAASGTVITWDGRLDNRIELIALINSTPSIDSTDLSIVSAAYERWGTNCLAKLIGDWALSIWSPLDRALILAKDPVGLRHLYYGLDKDCVAWCTVLDPLVLFAGKSPELDEEYIAGWLSLFPATHLTPYAGIHSVPPSSFVLITEGRCTTQKYWDFSPDRQIHYRSDAEYEKHFRMAFTQSVRRRLRSDRPILAELSGGMDSSSIVCMADRVMVLEGGEVPRVDTISYYDESEPNWNERPYFARVEKSRGRIGCHIDVSTQGPAQTEFETQEFAATPASGPGTSTKAGRGLAGCMESHGNRVVLSGIGGDEVLGGVPTPTPELMDLVARARFNRFASLLKAWALAKRKPWVHLFWETLQGFFPATVARSPDQTRHAPWLHPDFADRHRPVLAGYVSRVRLFGPLPSFQINMSALDVLRRQISCTSLPLQPPYEKRLPYLDRDLLEFLYAIPREQVVRPGERRSLMRRALAGMVPTEILNRRRKAFVVRSPMAALSSQRPRLTDMAESMVTSELGIVDPRKFREAMQRVAHGDGTHLITLMRTLRLEFWLRSLRGRRILNEATAVATHDSDFRKCFSSSAS